MGKRAISALRGKAVMTGRSSAGSNGEGEARYCVYRAGSACGWWCRSPRLAAQRDRAVESVRCSNGAVKNRLLAGKDGTSNRAAAGIEDGNREISRLDDDHGSLHR